MIVIICAKYKKNPSRTTDATERIRFSKSRPNDLEDIGQGQRSSHATHLLMLVIICTKYGKNSSRTVDATERTRFSRSRPNDLENIGQGQRSLYATHPLILKFQILKKTLHATHPLIIVIICAKYKNNLSRTVDATEQTRFFKSQPNDLEGIGQRSKVTVCDTPSHSSDHLWLIWKESIQNCRCYRADTAGGTDGRTDGRTDRRTDWNQYTPQQLRCLGGIISFRGFPRKMNSVGRMAAAETAGTAA